LGTGGTQTGHEESELSKPRSDRKLTNTDLPIDDGIVSFMHHEVVVRTVEITDCEAPVVVFAQLKCSNKKKQ